MAVTPSALIGAPLTRALVNAFKGETAKAEAIRVATDRQVQKAVDAVKAGITQPMDVALKGNAATNPIRAEVASLFAKLVDEAGLSKAAAANYATSFFIALTTNVPFQRGLFNTANANKASKASKPGSGKVEKTDRPALFKTLNKGLHQMRLLDDHDKAAAILDAIKAEYEDFTEVKPE